ncbi:threonylcarbamoyl-AMP synthase-like isoform X2 [Tubulanus polymorphus]|uniref:threonylcarbamoyl-AMP synthase-like isoform X2 n=1 Tax=Tubulanus polymorphus TaxID=672921 RepID=UPI003DA67AAC
MLRFGRLIDECIVQATETLNRGNIIAIPTDTIYGVAGLAQNSDAISKIYELKNRNPEKPIAICVADIEDVFKWGKVTLSINQLHELLPGPVTLLFERTNALNADLNPKTSIVGIRIPDHNFVRQLVRCCGGPLALTSANISSTRSTLAIQEFKDIWPKLDMVCDGGILGDTLESRAGSTVVDLSKQGQFKIVREGSAYKETVNKLVKNFNLQDTTQPDS